MALQRGVTATDGVIVHTWRQLVVDSGGNIAGGSKRVQTGDPEGGRHSEIRAQHDRLRTLLAALGARIDSIARDPADTDTQREMLGLVDELESLLPAHFACEEGGGGYLSQALAAAPRLRQRAERLLLEHRQLSRTLAHFARHARSAYRVSGWDDLCDELRGFAEAIRQHELDEDRLVQEAFVDDLGGGS